MVITTEGKEPRTTTFGTVNVSRLMIRIQYRHRTLIKRNHDNIFETFPDGHVSCDGVEHHLKRKAFLKVIKQHYVRLSWLYILIQQVCILLRIKHLSIPIAQVTDAPYRVIEQRFTHTTVMFTVLVIFVLDAHQHISPAHFLIFTTSIS